MVATIQAQTVDLRYLIDNFGLQRERDEQFFWEWQGDLPLLVEVERQQLDRVREGYFNLIDYPPLLENSVQLTIISPILFIAGFYLPPYHIKTEQSIEIQLEDEGVVIKGRIDILVLKQGLWALVIESKQISFSLEEGLAQLLAYMLANTQPEAPTFGMITNGADFAFIKLIKEENLKYALSDKFAVSNRGNELYRVVQILKRLSQRVN